MFYLSTGLGPLLRTAIANYGLPHPSGSAVELPFVYRTDEDGNVNLLDNLRMGAELIGEVRTKSIRSPTWSASKSTIL